MTIPSIWYTLDQFLQVLDMVHMTIYVVFTGRYKSLHTQYNIYIYRMINDTYKHLFLGISKPDLCRWCSDCQLSFWGSLGFFGLQHIHGTVGRIHCSFHLCFICSRTTRPGYDIHSSPWKIDGPNRNRWFNYLKWVHLSMVMFNNQMVYLLFFVCC
jgi:hypothetical protein